MRARHYITYETKTKAQGIKTETRTRQKMWVLKRDTKSKNGIFSKEKLWITRPKQTLGLQK